MNKKVLMLRSVVSDIYCEISHYHGNLHWNLKSSNIDEFISDNYSDYKSIINKSKIWVDLNLENIKYWLSINKTYLESDRVSFNSEVKNNIVDEIKKIYHLQVNRDFNNSKKMEYLDIIHDFIRKQITNEEKKKFIKNDSRLSLIIYNLDNLIITIKERLNRVISNFIALYDVSNMTDEKDYIDGLINELKEYYFNSLEEILKK